MARCTASHNLKWGKYFLSVREKTKIQNRRILENHILRRSTLLNLCRFPFKRYLSLILLMLTAVKGSMTQMHRVCFWEKREPAIRLVNLLRNHDAKSWATGAQWLTPACGYRRPNAILNFTMLFGCHIPANTRRSIQLRQHWAKIYLFNQSIYSTIFNVGLTMGWSIRRWTSMWIHSAYMQTCVLSSGR